MMTMMMAAVVFRESREEDGGLRDRRTDIVPFHRSCSAIDEDADNDDDDGDSDAGGGGGGVQRIARRRWCTRRSVRRPA